MIVLRRSAAFQRGALPIPQPKRPLLKTIRYGLEASAAYVLYAVFRVLPVRWASACGGWLAGCLGPLTRPHKTARDNIQRALPELAPEAQARALAEAWDNLGRVAVEYAGLSRLWTDASPDAVSLVGTEHLTSLRDKGVPVIVFSGHIANWEIIPMALTRVAQPPAIVYRAPNNPFVEHLLISSRGPTSTLQIQKGHGGARDIMRELKDGGIVAMLIDQKSNTGLPVPLFSRNAMTGDAIARIALRLNCALVPAYVERLAGVRFRVTFEEPWVCEGLDNSEATVRDLLVKMNERLETWIRNRPGQWLWAHNRWPKDETES